MTCMTEPNLGTGAKRERVGHVGQVKMAAPPDDEREGEVHEATMAAVVLGDITVHQLLLAQGHQLSRVDGICALHRSRR